MKFGDCLLKSKSGIGVDDIVGVGICVFKVVSGSVKLFLGFWVDVLNVYHVFKIIFGLRASFDLKKRLK